MDRKLIVELQKKRDSLQQNSNSSLKQHNLGKLTARERINVLLDHESFEEYQLFGTHHSIEFGLKDREIPCDGVIIGYGTIFGRPVFIFSQDFTALGGSVGAMHAAKISFIQKKSIDAGIPIIGINDSGGARIQEGINALAGYGEIFQNNIHASGFVPQISLICGPCAGGAVYSPALTDFILMSENNAYMFLTGPNIVKSVLHEDVTFDDLGGANLHSKKSGIVDIVSINEIDLLFETRKLFSFLPSNCNDKDYKISNKTNIAVADFDLDHLIPIDQNASYNMKDVILKIIDNRDFFELKANFAKNIIIGFARFNGKTVGIVANQPCELSGCLDIDASMKGARFIRFCDAFNIPIVSLVDVPGFLPGIQQESNGIIKHGAKLLYAYGEATVPKITIITRKAYGGAYIVMGSKKLESDINYAWPSAEITVLGGKQALPLLYKHLTKEEEKIKIKEYNESFTSPYYAASYGIIDSIIKPHETRNAICRSLVLLENKVKNKIIKKHDNLPL